LSHPHPQSQDFWPSCGYGGLRTDANGWLIPGDAWLRRFLARPELAVVAESCAAERALHEQLQASPSGPVTAAQIGAIADEDARANWRMFISFRDTLLAAGSIEAYYLGMFRRGVVDIPPLFVDLLAQVIVRHIMDDCNDAIEVRAAELLFRTQRIHVQDGQVLAGDREVLDQLNETGGFGELGRLLAQAQAPLRSAQLEVLGDQNAARYWHADHRFDFLLDFRHEVEKDLGHGIHFTLTRAKSGPKALARVLERWVAHLLGVQVRVTPQQRIDDAQWRWHVGLDVESTALLNDLYEDRAVEPARMQRLLSLFRLDFANAHDMRADVAGRPVYLGLATTADGLLRLKPQNLLLNLPLANRS
jgi:hypothetical protein